MDFRDHESAQGHRRAMFLNVLRNAKDRVGAIVGGDNPRLPPGRSLAHPPFTVNRKPKDLADVGCESRKDLTGQYTLLAHAPDRCVHVAHARFAQIEERAVHSEQLRQLL
jgi:hypothetical protein